MTKFRPFKTSLCLILVLYAATRQSFSSVVVRGGGEVSLPCENRMDQTSCTRTNWLFGKTARALATDLVKFGGTGHTQASRARGGRLSVSASCSLVIQKVSASDVGTYYCQQFNSLNQKETTNTAALALANFTEQKDEEEVTLECSVISNDPCKYTINWLLNGQNIDKEDTDFETEQSICSAKVTFQTSRLVYEADSYTSLKCEVAETGTRRKQRFAFRPQTPVSGVWWLYIIVGAGLAAGLAAVLFAVGLFIKRKKNKGNKTQVGENQGLNPHSTASQPAIEMSQDTDELDDAISYATIILPKTNNQFQRSDAAVTYSALKVGASPDPGPSMLLLNDQTGIYVNLKETVYFTCFVYM